MNAQSAEYLRSVIGAPGRTSRIHGRKRAIQVKSDKNCYPVRDATNAYESKVIMRRKRAHIPDDAIGTYESSGETSAAGSQQESLSPTDTLRNSSPMQSTLPSNRLLSATEIAAGVESDTLDRLQVVEREMWRAFRQEAGGENRPATRVRILKEIAEVQAKQVGVAKHVVRVERAVPVEWERLRDRVITALQNHPEALAAVMSALEGSDD